MTEVDCSDFITAVTLLVNYRNRSGKNSVSCKGEDILKLKYEDYARYRDDIIGGFVEVYNFLEDEGVSTTKYLPYKSQLIPMAAIFAELKLSGKYNEASRKKIRQWYWFGVFSESYKDGQGARYAKDIVQVMKWINKNDEPELFRKTQISARRLMSVKNTTSAAYKGLICVIFKNGAKDFSAGRIMEHATDSETEIHHIFPKKFCEILKFPKDKYDNIVNRTLIMNGTNRIIGSNPPSVYLERIQSLAKLNDAELDEILEGHFIDAKFCRADDFDAFFTDRKEKILKAVENLTGRKIVADFP